MKLATLLQKGALCCAPALPLVFLYHFVTQTSVRTTTCASSDVRYVMTTDSCAPALLCLEALAVELLPIAPGADPDPDHDGDPDAGAIEVRALELALETVGMCGSSFIRLSIHRVDDIISGENIPNPDQESLFFTCDDLGTTTLRIYAWDDNFNPDAVQPDGSIGGPNYSYCELTLLVQDNMFNLCQGIVSSSILGIITTTDDSPSTYVKVTLTSPTHPTVVDNTGTTGAYGFYDPPPGTYTVTPYKDSLDLNGLSGFDQILIRRHILGIQPLGSPYKMIAADVNNDKKITNLDIIEIRRLILGLVNTLPHNTSWRFVDKDYVFPNPTNPWVEAFPESVTFTANGPIFIHIHEFIAIKVGDVNDSAVP